MTSYRVLDLFSGIGGFSLGLERAGMETVAFCEQDGYARRVLRKHWPDVWLYEDVRTLTAKRLRKDGLDPNVICGGFPCQDISTAGKGAGIEGARSGLWSEMLRLVKEVRPLWVVAENVPALRGRGADRVLADLEGAGYSARPVVVGAVHVGAGHRRERVWIVAHANRPGRNKGGALRTQEGRWESESHLALCGQALADATGRDAGQPRQQCPDQREGPDRPGDGRGLRDQPGRCGEALADADDLRRDSGGTGESLPRPWLSGQARGRFGPEPAVGRVADGVPARVDRIRTLGNAVVPLIPELIGRAITEYDARTEAA